MFMQIELSKDWKKVTPISKGWSSDKKYLVETADGKLQLLRISDIDAYEAKKKEYEIITKYSRLGINMSMPLEFGTCNESKNVYMLLSWVEGRDLEEVLPKLSEQEQYKLGRQAGTILRKIHSIPLEPVDVPEDFWTANAVYVAQASLFSIKWAEKFGQDEIDGMVRRARASMINFDDFMITVPKWYSGKSDIK